VVVDPDDVLDLVLVLALRDEEGRGDDLAAVGANCAGLFVNRVRVEPPGFLRGAAP